MLSKGKSNAIFCDMKASAKKYRRNITVIGAVLVALFTFFNLFSLPGKASVRVEKKTLTQDITVQGVVQATHKIDLVFETEGIVKTIAVKSGDSVTFGSVLAMLDTRQLDIQRQHLEALIKLNKTKYAQFLSGVPKEEITLAQAKVESARAAVDASRRAVQDSQLKADRETGALYDKTAEYANTVLLNADNAIKALMSIYDDKNQFRDFFVVPDSREKTDAQWQMIFARSAFENIKIKTGGLKTDASRDAVNQAIADFKTNLEVIRSLLSKTSGILDETVVLLGSADIGTYRTTIAVQRSVLNETQSTLLGMEQDIAAQKATGQSAVAAAKNAAGQASAMLKLAEDELALKTSASGTGARSLLQAQIKEEESSLAVIKQKIENTILVAPADGVVQDIRIAQGGFIKAHVPVAVFTPLADLEIETELDPNQVALVKAGDRAIVSSGTLRADGMVSNVQGLRAIVYFQKNGGIWHLQNDAEVHISSIIKKDALMVPQEFIIEENGSKKLIITEKNGKKERIVLTGVVFGNEIEIIEGVSEGELLVR